jgi:zinc transport system ATP-binding protein
MSTPPPAPPAPGASSPAPPLPPPPLLEAIDLAVRRERETLLAGVSLAVQPASIHVVVGPNGAGKSTLLLALLGQIAFSGRVVAHWRAGGRIGFVPQGFAVDRTLPVTVEDFLALSRQRRPVCLGLAPPARRRIAALLARVGLGGLERRPLAQLSGGELRRVLLANAIDPLPELLVLDEPASGLDEPGVERLGEIVLELRRSHGLAVLMVSHHLAQVRRLADRVTVLDRRVLFEGPPEQALASGAAGWAPWTRPGAPGPEKSGQWSQGQ